MPQRGERQEVCQFGHNNWRPDNRGYRYCATCAVERKRKQRRRAGVVPNRGAFSTQKNQGDRGPREDTFTRTELLKARGYAV